MVNIIHDEDTTWFVEMTSKILVRHVLLTKPNTRHLCSLLSRIFCKLAATGKYWEEIYSTSFNNILQHLGSIDNKIIITVRLDSAHKVCVCMCVSVYLSVCVCVCVCVCACACTHMNMYIRAPHGLVSWTHTRPNPQLLNLHPTQTDKSQPEANLNSY